MLVIRARTTAKAIFFFALTAFFSCNSEPKAPEKPIIQDSAPVIIEKKVEDPVQIAVVDQEKLAVTPYLMVAANMLERATNHEDISKHIEILKSLDPLKLEHTLNTDEFRRCFWINVYNAFEQSFLLKDSILYTKDRVEFLQQKKIVVAGDTFSLNDIKHGVLRRGATIWVNGKKRITHNDVFIKKFMVQDIDYRIHFALNDGSASAPPICVYLPSTTDEQLNKVTKFYLQKECLLKTEDNKPVIMVPAMMNWYSDDFGSKEDKKEILRKYSIIEKDSQPRLDYKNYNWNLKLNNYFQF